MLKSILKQTPRIDSSNRINKLAKSHICEFFETDEVIDNKTDKVTRTVPLIVDDETTVNKYSFYDVQSTENSVRSYINHSILFSGTFNSKEVVTDKSTQDMNSFDMSRSKKAITEIQDRILFGNLRLSIVFIATSIFSFRPVTGSTIIINVDTAIIISCMLLVLGSFFPGSTSKERTFSSEQTVQKESNFSSMRNSINISVFGEEPTDETMGPLAEIPYDVKLGSKHSCWSVPPCHLFKVKGINYLKDKTKIGSGPYLFPIRGVDLFLTNDAPDNVGK